ncbi:unnamed protein product [Dovyalis caffra]|uniref:Alpha/beta hydrolase fold-3 domain-containing protein n=1 Tax=Dovyalis caffra TaxID=77055 RepID=A0AAV1QYY3_9ROSI|nr:unnamed protein product [Dovyalis caffra]
MNSSRDRWASLQWVESQSVANGADKEQCLLTLGDFGRVFIGGDSAGAHIVPNIAMKAGNEVLPGGVTLLGAFLTHPYLWGSKPIGSESSAKHTGGIDNPMINSLGREELSVARFGCSRLLVIVVGLDDLKERGVAHSSAIKDSG